ncbi:MAG: type II CAAX endopeptidase family protein [Planctomycetaceae bacterium]|nr:type II CAAX endopeptidase family protein [Planctomycetaceae bacterium]
MAIGRRLQNSPARLIAAVVIGLSVVIADLALSWWRTNYGGLENGRGTVAILGLVALVWLCEGDLAAVGLRIRPVQGWCCWIGWGLRIGLAVAACIAVGVGIGLGMGFVPPIHTTPPGRIGWALLGMCLIAPVLEETVYRLALCLPITAAIGPRTAIVVSGFVFGALHVVYGNPSPENLVGGFFLAWAYLKSQSLLMPVLLHSLGNLCALAAQVAAWFWFG